jgi:hypothetical protein
MPEFFSPSLIFAIAIAAGVIVWIIRDRNNRKERERIIREIENSRVKAVYFDTKSTLKARTPLAFHARWDNAEIIFTDKSILYFNYVSVFGYRVYMQVKHWYLRGAKIPHRLAQSGRITTLKIDGKNLVIRSSLRNSEVTNTLKDIVGSEQFATIQKMLNLSLANLQEG